MEVYSLGMTFALARTTGARFEWCFGFADTLVVPAAAGWSALVRSFGLIDGDVEQGGSGVVDRFGERADLVLGMVALAVAGFAGFKIATQSWRGAREG